MSVKLKICTFNLRTPVKADELNYFPNRKARILECIAKEDPDIIGFQEAAVTTADWLREELNGYVVIGCGRGKTLDDEASLIAYRKNAFEMISAETFWLSLAPSVPGSRYGADQSGCPRIATAAVLKHREADQWFLFVNTHLDHKGSAARMYGAIQILQYIDKKKLPFVLTGDLNAWPDAPEIRVIADCKYLHAVDLTADVGGTFHGFGQRVPNTKIDYIFSDLPADPAESYAVEDLPVDGVYISDHRPVISFVTLE